MLTRHREILQGSIQTHNGYVFQVVGDSFSAAFHFASDALHAALHAQQHLHHEDWTSAPIKVRMGIHTGAAQVADDPNIEGPYSGYATLAMTQRIMSAAHGGQILISQSTYELTRDALAAKSQFIDMGEHHLKSILRPVRLYQLSAAGLPSNFPPLKTLDYLPHNLPEQLTSFIGREKEIDEIKNLLHSARLVTLTGSGGTGKTRLSQEVGAQELINFPHGVWLIELASLTDPSQIIAAMAQVFGLQELPFNPLVNIVTDYLRDKKCLLILDNCERLIGACAHLTNDLLHHYCTGLKILASSRETLGIAGEVAYHVPSLEDSESTQLFLDRARAVNPNFRLTEAKASSIPQICSRLDGIPLAIELAAARVKLLSSDQIAARLDDRFRLLVGGSRTALPRQQTLRALIDWSYDLLSEEEKQLLQFAAVFVGGWTLEALEAVAEDPNTMEHLEQLVNKSLVATEERENEMRYFMLETIRQYAREKLFAAKQASAARDRHFFYFNGLSETSWDAFRSSNVLPLLTRIDDEIENFRAALQWGLENHTDENVRLAANFCVTSTMLSLPAEGVGIVMEAVKRAKALPPIEGEIDLYRKQLMARALFVQSMVGLGVGNFPIVIDALHEAIAISRAIGDKQMLGSSLSTYYTASTFIDLPGAEEAAQEALTIFTEEVNDVFGLGMDERMRGNYDSARKVFEEGRDAFLRVHSKYFVQVMNSELGHLERQQGNLTEAKWMYRETIKGWQDLGNRAAVAHQLECFGFLAIAEEEPGVAATLFGAAEALREKIQAPMTDYERAEYDQAFAQIQSMLEEADFNARWAEGRSMAMVQAIDYAVEEHRD